MHKKDFPIIDKGQWIGWMHYPDGTYSKDFGKNGNPSIHAVNGMFDAYNIKGHCAGRFLTLKEALKSVDIDFKEPFAKKT